VTRPLLRADCEAEPRPCPWVGCRHHLAIARIATYGLTPNGKPRRVNIRLVADWDDGRPTCALDVAEEGPHSVQETADAMGISLPRAYALEASALRHARERW
jgi:hypothetical protein